ncbi:DUF6414 family protein [Agromyces salentinus]|uniref:Uncharacterized protein n=1 Tax=Agromyces salentinus TaxID=269421 RepID=A0ABN2MFI7_9MICO|nr:hypothetical protein [Agromyces salentinus]
MLRNFLYLNEPQLDQYIAQVEDGLRKAMSRSEKDGTRAGGALGTKVLGVSGEKSGEQTVTEELADTSPAKFERLQQLVDGAEEQFGWVTILQEADLEGVRLGNLVDVTCELYEADASKIASPGGLLDAIPLMKMMAKLSKGQGMNPLAGMPDNESLDTMAAFGAAMPTSIVLGDVVDSAWRIVGSLKGEPLDEIDGDARVVGKVSKLWGASAWRPLPGLPIISQMPRDQRREFERKGPTPGQEMFWVEGPALQLDVLAIYR